MGEEPTLQEEFERLFSVFQISTKSVLQEAIGYIPSKKRGRHADIGEFVGKKRKITENSLSLSNIKKHFPKGIPDELAHLRPELLDQVMPVFDHKTNVTWDAIAGLEEAKEKIKECIVWPMLHPHLFRGVLTPSKGFLFFGPPGTGKTLIAKAIANECKAKFFNITASDLTSKMHGDTEKLVTTLFEVARHLQPSIIFIDEIDALLSKRTATEADSPMLRMKSEFLTQLEGVSSKDDRVYFIGATNKPQNIDEAARRRMHNRLFIPLPDASARRMIIEQEILEDKECNQNLSKEDLKWVVGNTKGFSGADMALLCKEAAYKPVRQMQLLGKLDNIKARPEFDAITLEHFKEALKTRKSSVSESDLEDLKKWNRLFGTISSK